ANLSATPFMLVDFRSQSVENSTRGLYHLTEQKSRVLRHLAAAELLRYPRSVRKHLPGDCLVS
ncbi:MAG: hypothetical protein ABW346_03405, partial [Terrimicrobium sp.]